MEIRLQCYESEKDAAVAGLANSFQIRSVSKGYPNVRQTSVEGTPSETRYYIKVDGMSCSAFTDAMVIDMLRFLAMLDKAYGIDVDAEQGRLRTFYDSSRSLTYGQQLELLSEWRAALLGRCLAGKG